MKLWEDFSDAEKLTSGGTGSGSTRKCKAMSGARTRQTKLCKAALAEFREADKVGYDNKAAIHIMSGLCLTKLTRWGEAVQEIKQALASIPKVPDGEEWSFQGLDRVRLVGMAVNLEKMHQAHQKSEVQKLLQAAAKTS